WPVQLEKVEQGEGDEAAARAEFEALVAAPNQPELSVLSGDDKKKLEERLLGKKFKDADSLAIDAETEFTTKDLPKLHRIFRGENQVMTLDYNTSRINVWLDENDCCHKLDWF
ncbi:hypothetical protein IWQ57_001770, partial [Coemansia nantahalensis]